MSNFIVRIFLAEFLSIFKVSEFEHKLEPGDLEYSTVTYEDVKKLEY